MSKTTSSTKKTNHGELNSSCKFRVYVNSQQHVLLGHYLYWVQKFRNEVVAFCDARRKERGVWMHQHPLLVAGWKEFELEKEPDIISLFPKNIAGSDVSAASRWLTARLEQARLDVGLWWNIKAPKKELRAHMYNTWVNLSQEERLDIPDAYLLTLPRTILDQCLQDMSKTYKKAIKDRAYNKANPSKKIKAAGFPQTQKHSYPYSVRFQISTAQNKTYMNSWNAAYANNKKEVYIPSLGVVSFRDQQQLPAIPPEMITIARNAAGEFHITFVNKDPTSKTNARLHDVNSHPLPRESVYDPKLKKTIQVPVVRGGDVGLKTLVTYSQKLAKQEYEEEKKNAKRVRFFKRQEKRLRFANKSVARKQYGSKRWQKAKIKQGRVHTQIKNQRHDYLKKEAQELVQHTAIVCLEDLNLRFMLNNKHLSKAASDASLGAFKQYIQWEAIKHGHLVIECGRFDATSKTCHACKYYYKDLTLNERIWTCPSCNILHDRDENAAINIRQMALLKTLQGLKDGVIVLWSKKDHSKTKTGSTASGNGVRMLSPYPLHKDLTMFIKRGGLTSLLALDCVSERHATQVAVVSDETLILPNNCLKPERSRL